MWYAAVLRFIRRRIVLGIIFLFSLTYCLVNLLGKGGPLSLESEEFIVQREHPMIWRTLQQDEQHNIVNRTNDLTVTCRNSVQGKVLIVDDRGFVCQRQDLLWNGCCNLEVIEQNSVPATDDKVKSNQIQLQQYSCDTCNLENCCSIYEYCVSCCLHPDKRELLERVISNALGHQSALFASVKDHFELCLVKCRTNSHSVQHENKYRDPKNKHCYGETKAYIDSSQQQQQQHQQQEQNQKFEQSNQDQVVVEGLGRRGGGGTGGGGIGINSVL